MVCDKNCKAINPRTYMADKYICVSCGKEIQRISSKQAIEIIDTREPIGLFYLIENGKYIGIDNTTKDAWTEEFSIKESCFKWLYGLIEIEEVNI